MDHSLTIDLDRIVPYLNEYPIIRLFSRRAGGAGTLNHRLFSGVRTLQPPTGYNTFRIDIPASSDFVAPQEYMLSIGGHEFVFVMPEEDATLSNLLAIESTKNSVFVQSTNPIDPLTGDFWIDTSANPPVLKFYQAGGWHSVMHMSSEFHLTSDELDTLRKAVLATESGITINERTLRFAPADNGIVPDREIEIPGITVEKDDTVQGLDNAVTNIDFTGDGVGVDVVGNKAVVSITGGDHQISGLNQNQVDNRITANTNVQKVPGISSKLDEVSDELEQFSDALHEEIELVSSETITIAIPNSASRIPGSPKVPADDGDTKVTAKVGSGDKHTWDLKDILKHDPVNQSEQMNDGNSISWTENGNTFRIFRLNINNEWGFTADSADPYVLSLWYSPVRAKPSMLPSATNTAQGAVELANQTEADAGTDATKAMTPALVKRVVDAAAPDASMMRKGVIEIASQAEADAGTDNTKAMTPKLVKDVVDANIPEAGDSHTLEVRSAIPAITGFSVGDMINVNGDLMELVDDEDEGNILTGTIGDVSGMYGTSAFNWGVADPFNIRVLLSKTALGSSPPASLWISVHLSSGETSSLIRLDRAPASDTTTQYGYHKHPGDPGIEGTSGTFTVQFFSDSGKTSPQDIHDSDRWEILNRSTDAHIPDSAAINAVFDQRIWFGTSAEFSALSRQPGVLYVVSS